MWLAVVVSAGLLACGNGSELPDDTLLLVVSSDLAVGTRRVQAAHRPLRRRQLGFTWRYTTT